MINVLSAVSFLSAGVCGMTSLVLWIRFDIPGTAGAVRGRTKRGAGKGRSRAGGRAEETERLDRLSLPGPAPEPAGVTGDDVMIIHTDEEIRLQAAGQRSEAPSGKNVFDGMGI